MRLGRAFVDRHPSLVGVASSLIFNIFRLVGMIRIPSYSHSLRYALGFARAGYWSPKVGKMGKGVRIDSGVIIRGNPRNLEIGDFAYIDTSVHLELYAPLRIGRYVHLTPNVYIQSGDEVTIGDFACIANNTRIYSSSNTHKAPDGREKDILLSMSSAAPPAVQYVETGPVVIEEYAFVGMNCAILPGVTIGKGAVIGAGSVVAKDIPPYAIAVGIPAKSIRQRTVPSNEGVSTAMPCENPSSV